MSSDTPEKLMNLQELPPDVLQHIATLLNKSKAINNQSYYDLKRVSKTFLKYIGKREFDYLYSTGDEFQKAFINMYNKATIVSNSSLSKLQATIKKNDAQINYYCKSIHDNFQEEEEDEEEEDEEPLTPDQHRTLSRKILALNAENIAIYKQLIKNNHEYIYDLANTYNEMSTDETYETDHSGDTFNLITKQTLVYMSVELHKAYLSIVLMDKHKKTNKEYFHESVNFLSDAYSKSGGVIKKDPKLIKALNYMEHYIICKTKCKKHEKVLKEFDLYTPDKQKELDMYRECVMYFFTHPTEIVDDSVTDAMKVLLDL